MVLKEGRKEERKRGKKEGRKRGKKEERNGIIQKIA